MKRLLTAIFICSILLSCTGSPEKREFSPASSALLIIDVQNAYLPVWNQSVFLQNIKALEKRAREAGVPVIYVRNIHWGMETGSRGWEFHPLIKPQVGDPVVEKKSPGSFTGTDLEDILDSTGASTLILTGLASLGCYRATLYQSVDMGYETIVVVDAHSDQKEERVASLNNSLANSEFLKIMETEDILFLNN